MEIICDDLCDNLKETAFTISPISYTNSAPPIDGGDYCAVMDIVVR